MAEQRNSFPVNFYHSQLGPYTTVTGLDSIGWSYELNTATFPTYQGEVIQILSVYIGDLTCQGTFHDYREAEAFYTYFSDYLKIASQGRASGATPGVTAYNQEPITMTYPHRNWSFKVQPTGLPGFRYGRDVVAPEWRLICHVVDDSDDVEHLKDLVVQHVLNEDQGESFSLVGQIGYVAANPFSDPFPDGGDKAKQFDPAKTTPLMQEAADWYNKLIPAYLGGDFSALTNDLGSKPAFGNRTPGKSSTTTTQQKTKADGSATGIDFGGTADAIRKAFGG